MNNLHESIFFKKILKEIGDNTGYRLDVLEKDYYVTMFLSELAKMQNEIGLKAYFKGGTALYKMLKDPKRFSEDIDLTVDVSNLNNSQAKKMLKMASQGYNTLSRVKAHKKEKNFKSEALMVYSYKPIVPFDKNDALQRFGELQIEATSFTVSEPIEYAEISSLLYDNSSVENQKILNDNFDMHPFKLGTISLERIFIDKIFAAEAYVRRLRNENTSFEVSKHIYDIVVLSQTERIKKLLNDEAEVGYLLDIQISEESVRKKSVAGLLPKEFIVFDKIKNNELLEQSFNHMESIYIFDEKNKISYDDVCSELQNVATKLWNNKAWKKCLSFRERNPSR